MSTYSSDKEKASNINIRFINITDYHIQVNYTKLGLDNLLNI